MDRNSLDIEGHTHESKTNSEGNENSGLETKLWTRHRILSTGTPALGACHYLTNRFQMEAPVAPSRSLQEASVGMAEAFSARDVFMKRS